MSNDLQSLEYQASELRKQGQFEEAIPLYEKLWQATPTKWIGWGYAFCLRRVGRSAEALEICRAVFNLDPNFDRNNSLYGWCIYDTCIKQPAETIDEATFLKAAEAITQLTSQGDYSPYEITVFAVIKYFEKREEKQKPVPYNKIMEWLDKLDVSQLSAVAVRGSDGKSYPSPREKWYTSRSKALLALERYEECIDICSRALQEFRRLHYDYDIWFRIQRAQCYLKLGRFAEAGSDLKYAIERKPDPWIRHRYAQALYEVGQLDEAIRYAAEAALPSQRLGYRWEVFLDLGLMLAEKGENELAAKHILLAAAIRREESWVKVPPRLRDALNLYRLSDENIPPAKTLHRELQSFWKSMKPRPRTTHTGVIATIHANEKSGHITGDDGKRYFFSTQNYKGSQKPVQNLRVAFNLRETISKKTGLPEIHAIDVIEEGA